MRAPLVLLLLAACGEIVPLEVPAPSSQAGVDPGAEPGAQRPTIELEASDTSPSPLIPKGLLADVAADEAAYAGWYAGARDRELFTLETELRAALEGADEQHPLRPEQQWLGQELARRAADPARPITAVVRAQRDFEARHRGRNAVDLAYQRWELSRQLSLHRVESGSNLLLL